MIVEATTQPAVEQARARLAGARELYGSWGRLGEPEVKRWIRKLERRLWWAEHGWVTHLLAHLVGGGGGVALGVGMALLVESLQRSS